MARTTIQLYQETVERLKGKKIIDQESYDHEINRLLDEIDRLNAELERMKL